MSRDLVRCVLTLWCEAPLPAFVRRVDAVRVANENAARTGVPQAVVREGKAFFVVPVEHAAVPTEQDLRPILRASLAKVRRR